MRIRKVLTTGALTGSLALGLAAAGTTAEVSAPAVKAGVASSADAHLYYGTSRRTYANVPRPSGVYPTGRIIATASTTATFIREGCRIVTQIQLQQLHNYWGTYQWVTEPRTYTVSVIQNSLSASWVQGYQIGRFRTRARNVIICPDGHSNASGWVQSNAVDIGRGW